MWRKGSPLTLLVEMQTSTATMANSVESPYFLLYFMALVFQFHYYCVLRFIFVHAML